MGGNVCQNSSVEVRGQPGGVGSLLLCPHLGPGDEIWVARFVSKHLYPLKYLAASHWVLIKVQKKFNGRQSFQQLVLEKLGIHVERAWEGVVVHAYKTNYSGGWSNRIMSSEPTWPTQGDLLWKKKKKLTVTKDESWFWKCQSYKIFKK